MMPRISVVPKISIRKKPLAISGMIRRITATAHAAGFSVFPSRPLRAAWPRLAVAWCEGGRPVLPGSVPCQRLASRPCGRIASTSTMIRKVTTIA